MLSKGVVFFFARVEQFVTRIVQNLCRLVLELFGVKSSCIATSVLLSTTNATTPGPNDNHAGIGWQDYEGSNHASEKPGAVFLPSSCEAHHLRHRNGKHKCAYLQLLKANPVDGLFTAKLRGLPR